MKKVWNKIVEVLKVIWNGIKTICSLFLKIFNTKEKLAAILLTAYIWHNLPVNVGLKVQVFALFFILGVLLLDIKEDK